MNCIMPNGLVFSGGTNFRVSTSVLRPSAAKPG
jgi:hypothetical protein